MRKSDLIRKNMVQSVKNERNILAMANNPFVVWGPSKLLAAVPMRLPPHAAKSYLWLCQKVTGTAE